MIGSQEFARRRRQVLRMIGDGAIAIIPAAPLRRRNGDVDYPYRQNSDFFYLTGFTEPDAVLLLAPGRARGESVLFCRERDPERELWDGPMAGLQGAREDHGVDDAYPIDDLDDIAPNVIDGADRLYYTLGRDKEFDQRVLGWVEQVRKQPHHTTGAPDEMVSLDHFLHDMRLIKNRPEVMAMRKSARIAGAAHLRAMQACRPGAMEYEIAADIVHTFLRHNAQPSYQPIVGAGANACVLHYVDNGARMSDGDLLLIDAGCEFEHYASDITRTIPVSGRFSAEQKAVYDIVLQAQLDAIDKVAPGNSWECPHQAAVRTISQGLLDLGLLSGTLDEVLENGHYKAFYMHKTGHWLGLDVHDVGDYTIDNEPRCLERGMAMTIEPGIYINGQSDVDERWHNIGIRIEDDLVVTRDGREVLSAKVPKTVEQIEQVMQ